MVDCRFGQHDGYSRPGMAEREKKFGDCRNLHDCPSAALQKHSRTYFGCWRVCFV